MPGNFQVIYMTVCTAGQIRTAGSPLIERGRKTGRFRKVLEHVCILGQHLSKI